MGAEGAQPMFTESLLLDIFAFIFENEKVLTFYKKSMYAVL